MGNKIVSFTDLNAWQQGHLLVKQIYMRTKNFPKEEIFGLVSQMRRCVVSITSNIAEGFSRRSYKEKAQFYSMSLGSITELQNQLYVARDVGYISNEHFNELLALTIVVHKITTGLVKRSMDTVNDIKP